MTAKSKSKCPRCRRAWKSSARRAWRKLTQQIQGMFQNMGQGRKKARKLTVKEAMKLLTDEEAMKLVNDEETKIRAIANVEQNGIVFIDEIDKIASRSEVHRRRRLARRCAARSVAAGRRHHHFHQVRHDQDRSHLVHRLWRVPSGQTSGFDPGIAGRLPIRVELDSLSIADFEAILTNTDAC